MTAEPDGTVVRCAKCSAVLAEPPDTPAEKRQPCPECGSTSRAFEGKASLGINVAVTVSAATARAVAPDPVVRVETALADAGFHLQWLRLSEGGAWLVRVFDEDGAFIDGSIQDDPGDALLAVAERLLPKP